jgi:hypothetical protein
MNLKNLKEFIETAKPSKKTVGLLYVGYLFTYMLLFCLPFIAIGGILLMAQLLR